MAKKNKTQYVCQTCGHSTPGWLGKCPECDSWNSFVEEILDTGKNKLAAKRLGNSKRPLALSRIKPTAEKREQIGISEFDRVLGGGIVPGGVFLIGGAPGMGKSTLLLQACHSLSLQGKKVLYVSGEESMSQIKMRADRLGVGNDNFLLLIETDVDEIIMTVNEVKPDVTVIDSVQTVYSSRLESLPGNVSQVRQTGHALTVTAKELNVTMFLVGHVTKNGSIAGPRVLEHLVDGLLLLEGDEQHQYRLLRAVKNRFGSTNEVGIFEMTSAGIKEVINPSEYLIGQQQENISGTVITISLEGTRPLLVEVQALVAPSGYGMPQRTATGIPHQRVAILLAVLEKRLGFKFGTQDVFLNTAGGLKLSEPSSDLAIVAALISSYKDIPLNREIALVGEIGLTGEVRGISHIEKRLSEACRLGFKRILIPAVNLKKLEIPADTEIIGIRTVNQLMEKIF